MSTTEAATRSRSQSPPHKKPRLDVAEKPATLMDGAQLASAPGPSRIATKTNAVIKASVQPKSSKKKNKRPPSPEPCSPEDVNLREVYEIIGPDAVATAREVGNEYAAPIDLYTEVEVTIISVSSHGEGIGLLPTPQYPPWAVLVPFALPGELVLAKIYRHTRMHSYADLVRVVTPNLELRDDSLVGCKYFGSCGGCQYQMMTYDNQLAFKQRVVEKAYRTYSGLPSSSVPAVLPTIASPKQYNYRTKITPHFDAAPKSVQKDFEKRRLVEGTAARMNWDPKIGFDQKGRRTVMDIEECPIATPVLNQGLTIQRRDVQDTFHTYKRASTLLLRDSLAISPQAPAEVIGLNKHSVTPSAAIAELIDPDTNETHLCITSHKATIRERVGTMKFDFPAGSFFQNNNSVLEPLTEYVKKAIFSSSPTSMPSDEVPRTKPTHLVDTYCGSGLFAITLSPSFKYVAGIEIDANAITCAKHNLNLNNLDITYESGKKKHAFHAGKSEDIFASVLAKSEEAFPPESTAVVIDPPRKGCDEGFIDQVVAFQPSLLVYVSCNVHTQARDVGMLIRKMREVSGGTYEYRMESLRGFDLFPQTAHVESVAVLALVSSSVTTVTSNHHTGPELEV